MDLKERLFQHVVKTEGCWLWTGCTASGYGMIKVCGKGQGVHRISYKLHKGPIPDGLLVCHTCDVRNCVNPEHLFIGTPQENTQDMVNKHRQNTPRGESSGGAKLTESDVKEIRRLRENGHSLKSLAKQFGVTHPNIHYICTKHTWAHV